MFESLDIPLLSMMTFGIVIAILDWQVSKVS